jgi:multidrug efflux system membrane fusion protein
VQRGPNGTFVYAVQPDNTVIVRLVTVSQQDETQAVITRGLQSDERVVTTGFARLTVGTQVAVTNAETVLPASAQPAEPQRRPGRRERGERRSDAPSGTIR